MFVRLVEDERARSHDWPLDSRDEVLSKAEVRRSQSESERSLGVSPANDTEASSCSRRRGVAPVCRMPPGVVAPERGREEEGIWAVDLDWGKPAVAVRWW